MGIEYISSDGSHLPTVSAVSCAITGIGLVYFVTIEPSQKAVLAGVTTFNCSEKIEDINVYVKI